MNAAKNILSNLLQDESGQDLIEYALVAGLVGLGAVAAMTSVGGKVTTLFTSIGTSLTSAV
jgi:pilus assembly protein Flp/PilA